MQIRIGFEHVFSGQSTELENAFALRALLDCLTTINVGCMRRRSLPRLYESGVRYRRIDLWEPVVEIYSRGFADCKGLSCILCAEYRLQGIEAFPVFRFAENNRGGNDFHILVAVPSRQGYDGAMFEDPSVKLGMNEESISRYRGAIVGFQHDKKCARILDGL
jgi:hypothetical protein